LLICAGFSSDDAACAAGDRKLPSQFNRKFRTALKTVRVSNGRDTVPSLGRAPLVRMSWQDEQASVPLSDRRGSENRRSPSASLFGSATGGWGTAEIGSSSNGFVHVPCGFCGRPGVCEGAW